MLKKIVFVSILSVVLTATCIAADSIQLNHIRDQIKAVLRSWQQAEMTVRQAQKIAPQLSNRMETVAAQIIALENIDSKINSVANEKYNAIVNNSAAYQPVDLMSTYFPEKKKSLKPYLYSLCSAMANRKYRLLLWRKLVKKEKELADEVESEENIGIQLYE